MRPLLPARTVTTQVGSRLVSLREGLGLNLALSSWPYSRTSWNRRSRKFASRMLRSPGPIGPRIASKDLRAPGSSLGYATVLGLNHHVSGLHQGQDPLALLKSQLLGALAGDECHHLVALHVERYFRRRLVLDNLRDRAGQPIARAECHRGSSFARLGVMRIQGTPSWRTLLTVTPARSPTPPSRAAPRRRPPGPPTLVQARGFGRPSGWLSGR